MIPSQSDWSAWHGRGGNLTNLTHSPSSWQQYQTLSKVFI
jgi:hypothetical protein